MNLSTTKPKLAHLYRRAGFGANRAELDKGLSLGLSKVLDDLLNFEQNPDTIPTVTIQAPEKGAREITVGLGQSGEQSMTNLPVLPTEQFQAMSPEEKMMHRQAEFEQLIKLRVTWLNRMILTQRPLQEKMAFFWHGHFATSVRKVQDSTLMENQVDLFRQYGTGNFETLVQAVSKDPAMILWLDTQTNRKQHPNENYGRELMELFTLGIGNYSEQDIREAARAFTGWKTNAGNFVFIERQHDRGLKTVLGQIGSFDGGDVVKIVSRNPITASFIARKLFSFLGYADPEPKVVTSLADTFAQSGYNIKELLRAIFQSHAFWSPKAYRAKVKSPVELVVSAVKILGGTVTQMNALNLLERMGQSLYDPPSVKGWTNDAGWLNTSSLFDRFNFAWGVVQSKEFAQILPFHQQYWEVMETNGGSQAEQIVDYFVDLLIQTSLPQNSRDAIVAFAEKQRRIENQAQSAVYMILCTPEFQMA